MTKTQAVEERDYSAYTSILMFITNGSQDSNLCREQELGGRSWYRNYGQVLFIGLLSLVHSSCFLKELNTASLEKETMANGLIPFPSITKNYLTPRSFGTIWLVEVPFFQIILVCVSIWYETSQHRIWYSFLEYSGSIHMHWTPIIPN